MSRSLRHTPIFGNTMAESEKRDKQLARRRWRRRVRVLLHLGEWEILPLLREVSNLWDFDKDGRRYWQTPTVEAMRK